MFGDGGAAGRPSSAGALRGDGGQRDPGFSQTDSYPVTCMMMWDDAQEYVSWLSPEGWGNVSLADRGGMATGGCRFARRMRRSP